jgi:hypothetical protein
MFTSHTWYRPVLQASHLRQETPGSIATRSPGLTPRTPLPTLGQERSLSHIAWKWGVDPPLDTTPDDSWPRTFVSTSEGALR